MPNTPPRKSRPAAKATSTAKRVSKSVKKAPAAKRVTKTVRAVRTAAKRSVPAKRRAPAKGPGRPVDAIALLKQDHREVQDLFRRFERAGENAHRTKRQLVDRMIEALSRHAGIEEVVFYPAVRREVARSTSDVLEAIEEHHVVKILLRELEDLDPANERFDAKVTVMIENVRHHVREEEDDLFPRVRKALSRSQLLDIGAAMKAAKPGVPSRPHPYAPDEPPGNVLVGGAVAVFDRARTVGKKAVERVREELPAL